MIDKSEEIFTFLRNLLLGFLELEEDAIQNETTIASLKMESLDFVELQVEFEKKYRVKVRSAIFSAGKVETIGQFVAYVQALLETPPTALVG